MDDQPPSCHHSDTSLETITLNVNGHDHYVGCDWRSTLLLRDNLSLTGSKRGCDSGRCGARDESNTVDSNHDG
jgi:xanthine dehydrogenase YagT iron-sulfur-binding subunit